MANTYDIERQEDGGAFSPLALGVVQGTETFTDTTVVQGVIYRYRICTVNEDGRSPWVYSQPISLAQTASGDVGVSWGWADALTGQRGGAGDVAVSWGWQETVEGADSTKAASGDVALSWGWAESADGSKQAGAGDASLSWGWLDVFTGNGSQEGSGGFTLTWGWADPATGTKRASGDVALSWGWAEQIEASRASGGDVALAWAWVDDATGTKHSGSSVGGVEIDDDFTRPDETGLLPPWVGPTWNLVGGELFRQSGGSDYAYYDLDLGTPDHGVEASVNAGNSEYLVVNCRRTPTNNSADGYLGFWNPATQRFTIGKSLSGAYSDVALSTGTEAGPFIGTLRLECEGTEQRLYADDVLVATGADTDIDGVTVGGQYAGVNANADAGPIDNFRAFTLGGVPPTTLIQDAELAVTYPDTAGSGPYELATAFLVKNPLTIYGVRIYGSAGDVRANRSVKIWQVSDLGIEHEEALPDDLTDGFDNYMFASPVLLAPGEYYISYDGGAPTLEYSNQGTQASAIRALENDDIAYGSGPLAGGNHGWYNLTPDLIPNASTSTGDYGVEPLYGVPVVVGDGVLSWGWDDSFTGAAAQPGAGGFTLTWGWQATVEGGGKSAGGDVALSWGWAETIEGVDTSTRGAGDVAATWGWADEVTGADSTKRASGDVSLSWRTLFDVRGTAFLPDQSGSVVLLWGWDATVEGVDTSTRGAGDVALSWGWSETIEGGRGLQLGGGDVLAQWGWADAATGAKKGAGDLAVLWGWLDAATGGRLGSGDVQIAWGWTHRVQGGGRTSGGDVLLVWGWDDLGRGNNPAGFGYAELEVIEAESAVLVVLPEVNALLQVVPEAVATMSVWRSPVPSS